MQAVCRRCPGEFDMVANGGEGLSAAAQLNLASRLGDPLNRVKIYVVSLKRAVVRRQAISRQLEAMGLPFELIDAVDAKEIDPEVLENAIDMNSMYHLHRRKLSEYEICCTLSHRLIYGKIVKSDQFGAIILEDDAILKPEFRQVFEYFNRDAEKFSDKWRMYDLEALSRPCHRGFITYRRTPVRVSEGLEFRKLLQTLSFEKGGTCGYYITRRAAADMLSAPKVEAVADRWSLYAARGRGDIYISYPNAVIHPSDVQDSHIESSRSQSMALIPYVSAGVGRWIVYIYMGVRVRVVEKLLRPAIEFFI